uniref:Ig-like domain-containing protein n=1 Tax=Mola mola TaxID=94237 RepID=A0A3Q3XM14_MOLML
MTLVERKWLLPLNIKKCINVRLKTTSNVGISDSTFEFEVNEDDVEGRWLKNGVEIQFSVEERYSYVAIRKLHRLTISETYRSDSGEYTFIAGKNRSTMHLRVNSKSRKKESPPPLISKPHMVDSSPEPQWPVATSIASLKKPSIGQKPVFIQPITSCTVSHGEVARFHACVSGMPKPEISWFHNRQPIQPTKNRAVRLVANTDHQSEMSEQGEKYVSINFDVFAESAKDEKIEFKGKSSDMCSFQFQVTETPPKCIIPLTNVTAAVGTPVILQCLVTGKPNPTAEWYKDGERVTDSRCIIQEKTAGHFNLLILYWCIIPLKLFQFVCIFYLLSLEMNPPVFVSKPEPLVLYVGKQAVFQCSVAGSSPMEVVWHKDNIAISSEGKYVMKCENNKYSLHIKSLEFTNQGVYLCKASNSVGTATFTTELRVINKPSFVKTFEPVSADIVLQEAESIGSSAVFECEVSPSTAVTSWMKDGSNLRESPKHKFTSDGKDRKLNIIDVQLSDTGEYTCLKANRAMSSAKSKDVLKPLNLTPSSDHNWD